MMNNENLSFLVSYLTAHRIAGYLFTNKVVKPLTVEQEAGILCLFAEFVREVLKNTPKFGLITHKAQYGIAGITEAIELDLKNRGQEWEFAKIASDSLEKLKSFS